MTDIAIIFDGQTLSGDISLSGVDLLADNGLTTAVIISLFTDARALPDDVIPDGTGNPRGWWADRVDPPMRPNAQKTPDRIGSRLWLLSREKQLDSLLPRVKAMIAESLAWLIEDAVAAVVAVDAWFPRPGWLGFAIDITEPSGNLTKFRFQYAWGGK